MKRPVFFLEAATLALWVITAVGMAQAQYPGRGGFSNPYAGGYGGGFGSPYGGGIGNPYARPTVSPYLNLLRGGTNPALNYYGIVRPEMDFRRSLNQMQLQGGALPFAGSAQQDQPGVLPATGHLAFFRNYAHYYVDRNNPAGGLLSQVGGAIRQQQSQQSQGQQSTGRSGGGHSRGGKSGQ